MRDELINDVELLFKSFLSADLALRYCQLLRMNESHWKKIDPWKVWKPGVVPTGYFYEWTDSASTLLDLLKRTGNWKSLPTVLQCGHDIAALDRRELSGLVLNEMLEGFISLVPGNLAIVLNHDGDIAVLSRAPFNKSLNLDAATQRQVA